MWALACRRFVKFVSSIRASHYRFVLFRRSGLGGSYTEASDQSEQLNQSSHPERYHRRLGNKIWQLSKLLKNEKRMVVSRPLLQWSEDRLRMSEVFIVVAI